MSTYETIEGLTRQLLERIVMRGDIRDSAEAMYELRALLAAPVVVRRPLIHITPEALAMIRGERKPQAGGLTFSESEPLGGWTVPLYEAPPELAELQATIAQLRQHNGGVTHWANPEYSETITAGLKAHNMSMGGAPAAAVARYTIALAPIIQSQGEQVTAKDCHKSDWTPEDLLFYAGGKHFGDENGRRLAPPEPAEPAPAAVEPILVEAVAVTRECDEEGLRLEWLLEGGIAALELAGSVLFVAHGTVTNDKGHGYVIPVAGESDE
jgi:hypothetical protein